MLSMTWELLQWPFERWLFRNVTNWAYWSLKVRSFNILRHRNKYLNVISNALLFVVGFSFDKEFDSGRWRELNDCVNWEQGFDSHFQPVTHKFKLSIWWHKCDHSITLELAQSDTLMELNIIELNSFGFGCPSLGLIICFVIQT